MKEVIVGRRRLEIQESVVDKVISYFDPARGARRLKAKAIMALAGGYAAASRSKRSLSQWSTGSRDADSDILFDLPLLRDRSRDMLRNSPLASGAVNTVVTNVIGQGLKLQCRIDRKVLGMTDEEAEAWEWSTELEWQMWSGSQECDVARTLTFADIQSLVFRQVLENGDVFVLMPRFSRGNNPYTLKLQVIEADRVSNENNAPDSDMLAAGVEKDEYGAPLAYHVMKQHPGNILYATRKKYEWNKVAAFGSQSGVRNVIHLFNTLRPGQTRGVPYLTPVIEPLKQLERYTEAELMAAVVASMFTVFIKTETGEGLGASLFSDATDAGPNSSGDDYKLGNGAIVGLAANEDISTANPGRPNAGFDPFVKAILQQIGVALEIPYEVLIHHFSSSYSASRAALIEVWRFFRNRRAWLARNYCQLVYENWLIEAIARGRVEAPGFFADARIRHAYLGTLWIGDAPGQIDPMKEVNAAEKRIGLGLSTMDEETVAITGGDFERNYPRIVKERGMMQAAGMWQPVTIAPVDVVPDEDDEDDEEDGK